jgi:hypothetical protein
MLSKEDVEKLSVDELITLLLTIKSGIPKASSKGINMANIIRGIAEDITDDTLDKLGDISSSTIDAILPVAKISMKTILKWMSEGKLYTYHMYSISNNKNLKMTYDDVCTIRDHFKSYYSSDDLMIKDFESMVNSLWKRTNIGAFD